MIRLFATVPKQITITQIDSYKMTSGNNELPYSIEMLETIWIIGRRLSPARCLHVARKQHGFKTVVPQSVKVSYCTVTLQIDTEKHQAEIAQQTQFSPLL